jgi:hypothetical protein
MIEAELPDGTVLEFPEGTSPDIVQKAVKSRLGVAAPKAQPSLGQMLKDQIVGSIPAQLGMGAVRGAGSIGATLMAPFDYAERGIGKLMGADIPVPDRRTAMTEALRDLGADVESTAFKTGKIGAEVAGSLGAGPAVGAALSPMIASRVPLLVNAIKSGGMSLGGTTGSRIADIATRIGGGAISGGATAGLVSPEDAKTGAAIGAVAPPVIQAAGQAGRYVGQKAAEKYADKLSQYGRQAPLRDTVRESVEAGYVIPPNMVEPSAKNAIIESFSGKQATSQIASVRNQQVTEKLVRQSLGLADDVPLTKGALDQIRKIEGGAYQKVANLSDEASQTLEALKQARNDAQGWFNAYNRSASPADLAKAKEFRDVANNLENALEFHATAAGKEELIPALKQARTQIAKTYTVERALNDAGGTVNARVLGRLYEKGKPLSGGLEVAGKFASRFPSIAQAPQQMGSPAAHNLRSMASLLLGGGGLSAAGPVGIAAGAVPFVAPAISRSLMFREGAQRGLLNQAAPTMGSIGKMSGLLSDPEIQQLLIRSAPAISASR